MPRRNWISATGFILPEGDVPEEVIKEASEAYPQAVTPFLKIENDEPLTMLGIKPGDIVGIKVQNQSSSGIMCANQIIEPKKHLTLPAGKEFNFTITKLRERPTSIFSEIRDYLNEL